MPQAEGIGGGVGGFEFVADSPIRCIGTSGLAYQIDVRSVTL